jgi:transcriptional regulator with XRE-family HTH domain
VAQVSDRVRRLRKRRGLTQEEVARRAGLTLNSYGDIERGHVRDPHLSSLEAIAQALGVPIQELVSEEIAVPLGEVPQEAGLAGADPSAKLAAAAANPSAKLAAATVLEEIAELWAEQLARGFYDRSTLGRMRIAGFTLAANHEAAVRKVRETLPPKFRAQLEAAEEQFAAVGAQLWALEEVDRDDPVPPDELAAKREAKREELRQQLRGRSPLEAGAN